MPALLTYNWLTVHNAWVGTFEFVCMLVLWNRAAKSILQIETTFILTNIFKLQVNSSSQGNQTLFCKALSQRVFSTTYVFLSLNQRDKLRCLVFHWWLHWEVCHGQRSVCWPYSPMSSSCAGLTSTLSESFPSLAAPILDGHSGGAWPGAGDQSGFMQAAFLPDMLGLQSGSEQLLRAACLLLQRQNLQRHLPAPPPGNAHPRKSTHTSLWWPCRVGLYDDPWASSSPIAE